MTRRTDELGGDRPFTGVMSRFGVMFFEQFNGAAWLVTAVNPD